MKQNENIRLIGEKVILVPYEPCHVPKYHLWMEDEELRRLTASERLSLECEYEMQKKWRQDDDKCTFIILSKELSDDGRSEIESMIGDVNLFLMKNDENEIIAELEIMIAEISFRGRGIGREAVSMMILYGVEYLKLKKFQVKISEDNLTSLKLFEKLGFKKVNYSQIFNEITLLCDLENDLCRLERLKKSCIFKVDNYHQSGTV